MCGIAGWLGHVADERRVAAQMQELLRHRGPDAQSARFWPDASLIHTRLSIIDLSESGTQPIGNEDGSIWAVFNGELYNHRELRRELARKGHCFRGHSDSEVLPHLYEEYGADLFEKLRGMFAVGILDLRARRLLLGRDRFGIKPLFYAPGSRRLAFASEIAALRQLPDIDDRFDRQAIADCAALFYIPAPETLFTGIRALEPCQFLDATLDGDHIRSTIRTYHHWVVAPQPGANFEEVTERADELLNTAVSRQLESDVPLGSLLSGGIDSSLVSAAAQAAVPGGIRTFNVRFSDTAHDETWAAKRVADHIGSHHETLDIKDGHGGWDDITALLLQAGQPFADPSLFAVNAVCRLMRRHVTVALSGDGGDEGFGGYDAFWRIARIARLQRLPAWLLRGSASALDSISGLRFTPSGLPRRLRELSVIGETDLLRSLVTGLRAAELQQLCPDTADLLPVRRLFEPQWSIRLPDRASRLERLSARNTELYFRLILPNVFLFKVDTASMRESLEVRVPMLDEDLVAFALTLPHHLKVKGTIGKRVLRELAKRRLPTEIASKPKQGFDVPVETWVNDAFKAQVRETILSPSSPLAQVFRAATYRPWVEDFCESRQRSALSRSMLSRTVTMLLSMHLALSAMPCRATPNAEEVIASSESLRA